MMKGVFSVIEYPDNDVSKRTMQSKMNIRAPTASPTTDSKKGRQPSALGTASLSSYLGASRNLYAQSHLQERWPPLTQSPRK
ncbi:hypothetical protein AVEN_71396-1 [Araneus ventricosus]|uniref:Uncharacterized protein n=1 Tax=Araneus ventricosus TaxID=182803 RepID=A0A4Y2BHN6_ARAVE|nr:hypothetical protein AVEN_71396-1 [Araneus ventricosus]